MLTVHEAQTEILAWLKSRGHEIDDKHRIGRPRMTWQETRDWLLQKSREAERNR